jgi:hypothetical protein
MKIDAGDVDRDGELEIAPMAIRNRLVPIVGIAPGIVRRSR